MNLLNFYNTGAVEGKNFFLKLTNEYNYKILKPLIGIVSTTSVDLHRFFKIVKFKFKI